jgi:hypothetical protein
MSIAAATFRLDADNNDLCIVINLDTTHDLSVRLQAAKRLRKESSVIVGIRTSCQHIDQRAQTGWWMMVLRCLGCLDSTNSADVQELTKADRLCLSLGKNM